jgi:hypothetical protein
MAAPQLDHATAKATLDAYAAHGNKAAAARALGVPEPTFKSRLIRAMAMANTGDLETNIRQPVTNYEAAWRCWDKAIGLAKDRYKGPRPKKPAGTRIKIAAAGDFHVPFHDGEAVAELVAKEGPSTDLFVMGGDFGDAYSASVFTQYDDVAFVDEMAEQTACMQVLSEGFQQISYLRGSNHMDRFEKRFRERLDKNLVDAILYMTGGELSPDLALVKRYPNIAIDCWVTPTGEKVPWLNVIGDVAFSHAEKYSRVPGSAMRSVEEWLDDFSVSLGLPEIRAVVQFHTHAMALLPWRSQSVLIEPGCMCLTQGYQLRSKIGGRPQRVGYVTFEMEHDRIDFDSIRLRWLNRHGKKIA